MRIKRSCGTSSATKKGTLKFGIRNAQDEIIPVALELLLVRDLGANLFSVGALAEKGVKCDLLSAPPVLRHGTNYFSISTELPWTYVVNMILDDVNGSAKIFRTEGRRTHVASGDGPLQPRALQQLPDKDNSGVKFYLNIESGDCEVCSIANSKKSSHPPSDRPRAQTRLEIVIAGVWEKNPVELYSGVNQDCGDVHGRQIANEVGSSNQNQR